MLIRGEFKIRNGLISTRGDPYQLTLILELSNKAATVFRVVERTGGDPLAFPTLIDPSAWRTARIFGCAPFLVKPAGRWIIDTTLLRGIKFGLLP